MWGHLIKAAGLGCERAQGPSAATTERKIFSKVRCYRKVVTSRESAGGRVGPPCALKRWPRVWCVVHVVVWRGV